MIDFKDVVPGVLLQPPTSSAFLLNAEIDGPDDAALGVCGEPCLIIAKIKSGALTWVLVLSTTGMLGWTELYEKDTILWKPR